MRGWNGETSLLDHVPAGSDPDAAYLGFVEWANGRGLTLYPAQDEAVIEIVSGANVILSTPTGTGKSLVAVAAHAAPSPGVVAATTPPPSRPS